jgi:hypothetical protein
MDGSLAPSRKRHFVQLEGAPNTAPNVGRFGQAERRPCTWHDRVLFHGQLDSVLRSPERVFQFDLALPHRTDQARGTAVGLLARGYPCSWNCHDRSGHGRSQSRRLGQPSPYDCEPSPNHRPSLRPDPFHIGVNTLGLAGSWSRPRHPSHFPPVERPLDCPTSAPPHYNLVPSTRDGTTATLLSPGPLGGVPLGYVRVARYPTSPSTSVD